MAMLCSLPRGCKRKQIFKELANAGFVIGRHYQLAHVRIPRRSGGKDLFDVMIWFYDLSVMRKFEREFNGKPLQCFEPGLVVSVKTFTGSADHEKVSAEQEPQWIKR
jgi:hypothetical protein